MAYESSDRRRVTVDTVIEDTIPEAVEPRKVVKLRPLYDRILVRVEETPTDVVVNGVYRPDSAVEKPMNGYVLAKGPGRIVNGERIPIDVTVGNKISFGKYSGNEIEALGEKLLLLQESEIFGEYYQE